MLKPGDDALATPVSLTVTRKTPQELANALAWRRGMLVFRNTRLADVVRACDGGEDPECPLIATLSSSPTVGPDKRS